MNAHLHTTHNYDTLLEQQVLACCLVHDGAFASVHGLLTPQCFAYPTHSTLYDALHSIWQQGFGVDVFTIAHQLQSMGVKELDGQPPIGYLAGLCADVQPQHMLAQWCQILRTLAARRLMIQLTTTPYTGGDVVDEAARLQAQLQDVLQVHTINQWIDAATATIRLQQHIDELANGQVRYLSTTFPSLDKLNGGFRPGQLVVLGARPSVGKSALAGSIALQAATQGYRVGFLSLEMPVQELMGRIASLQFSIPHAQLDRQVLPETMQQFATHVHRLSPLPIYFSDTPQATIHDIRARAEQLRAQQGIDILIVDYLQLIDENPQYKQRNREQNISAISRGLKLIAMQLQIPVIALSQLNRESEHRANKRPTLADLRESGAIEQDADIVMLLHRDWKAGILTDEQGNSTEHQAQLIICKWRNGTTLDLPLNFAPHYMKFTEAF